MRKYVFGALVIMIGVATAAAETRTLDEVKEPDKATPLAAWTPAQQWIPDRRNVATWGYGSSVGMLVFADELGDKLAETGRASLISRCFDYAKEDGTSALMWALCGPDVKALDLKKLDAQLAADHLDERSRKDIVDDASRYLENAKKVGAAVEAAAKDDPGVAAVLKLADTARAEWSAYLAKNKAAFDRYLALKDAVRSNKSNHKNFAGCWEATHAPFVKLVKKTKFPWELSGDYLPGYMAYLLTTTEDFITTASFALCSYSVHEAGEALAAGAMNQDGGVYRIGWRTIALAKALDPKFNPKFADRSLRLDDMRFSWKRASVKMAGINDIAPIQTPSQGVVASAKKTGDVVSLTFKGDTVDACLQWKETRKVQHVSPNGTITYEKVCKKRGKVANQESATEIPAKFAAGIAPGVNVLIVYKFPVVAWKGKKFVSVFGVKK